MKNEPDILSVQLLTLKAHECAVEYDFAMKRLNGNIEHIGKGVLETDYLYTDMMHFKPLKIQKQKSEQVSLDVISIMCKLKHGKANLHQASALNEVKVLELISK